MAETVDLTRVESDAGVNSIKTQKMAAEDTIVEIAGRTGSTKKWATLLSEIENTFPEDFTPEQSAVMDQLQGQFGRFTTLVIETWNAPANVYKRSKNKT